MGHFPLYIYPLADIIEYYPIQWSSHDIENPVPLSIRHEKWDENPY